MGAPTVLNTPPKVALVGGGFIGPVHCETLRRIGVPVVGVLEMTPELGRKTAERLGIPRVFADLDAMLADPEVGAVHIASPNFVHYEQARAALLAGKHVLCEKPLALNSTETGDLAKLSAERPKQAAAVNYNVRFYPLCHEMRARVARGDLGKILSITGSYTQDWLLQATDYNWRVEPDHATNLRAISDIGTHWMDLAQFATGLKIERVMADLAIFHPERRKPVGGSETYSGSAAAERATEPVTIVTEDYGAVVMHWTEGVRGVYHVNQCQAGRKNRLSLEISGTEGSIAWDSETPNRMWIGRRGRPSEAFERDWSIMDPAAADISHYPGGHAEGFPDAFKQLALSFYGWIGGGCSGPAPFPTFADGHHEVQLCEAIASSARGGTWESVAS
ncbi:Gfo/Idh/MocA family protein [Tautonia plasticadhaerens]|uniref:Glucose-6-phosphate 3-dehydrogenase n=1 Tax=Tautonia plasticadhaerens TaxID=2527974 RepID=A0A518GW82_9BACT|nr:Gfo/Idh/MocA family oxidoreductase [Tautonia plasticadhaerens]QDV32844.1 Glucose-6-phosphate 3-dehydrogenase [Tautonia plasticadhaerens]